MMRTTSVMKRSKQVTNETPTYDIVPELSQLETELYGKSLELLSEADKLRTMARIAAQTHATYEQGKNATLLRLRVEEAEGDAPKMTETIRKAMYRTENAEARLVWILAEQEQATQTIFVKALQVRIESLRSLIASKRSMFEAERRYIPSDNAP